MKRAEFCLVVERTLAIRIRRRRDEGELHESAACQERRLRQIHAVKQTFLPLGRELSGRLEGRDRKAIEKVIADIPKLFAK